MARKRNTLPKGQSVLSIRLPIELHEQLGAVAEANDRTMAQEARRALTQHLDRKSRRLPVKGETSAALDQAA